MIFDNLTQWASIWGAVTVAAILAITFCKGCCIAKFLGKPCPSK